MISYHDKEYKQTKLIKQGKAIMDPFFRHLARWISQTYGVNPINIVYDLVITGGVPRPRLEIIFEYLVEKDSFRNDSLNYFNYDDEKLNAIIAQFKYGTSFKMLCVKSFWELFAGRIFNYKTEGLFVVISAFEPVAKAETNSAVSQSKLETLQNEISNTDVWTIIQAEQTAIIFFHTEKQLKEYSKGNLKQVISAQYLKVLKEFDEFGFYKKESFQ